MTPIETVLTVAVGFVSGLLSGLFGVGGGIVMTPGLNLLVSLPPVISVETPLPVIFPTAAVGAATYWRAGEVDLRAAAWIGGVGAAASIAGAAATEVVGGRVLLLITAVLLAWQSVHILRGGGVTSRDHDRAIPVWALVSVGLVAGFLSGLLGIGGGLVIVPALAGIFGMPLKRTLGTSLLCIVAMVVPGSVVHAALGNIDWYAALLLVIGSVPGARIGATIALGARERTLRLMVGSFMALVALGYGLQQVLELAR